ncbi:MAG: TolC family protein [Gammaproteobacteria bacterium]
MAPVVDFKPLAGLVEPRTGQRIQWQADSVEHAAVDQVVAELLAQPLSLDATVQIALLNNPELQASYEELGLAQADLVQAGLLDNPVFSASARAVIVGGGVLNWETGIVQSVLSLLLRPERKKIAGASLERARQHVAQAVITLAADVQHAYFRVLGAGQLAGVMRVLSGAAETSYAFAEQLDKAGNISDLDLAQERAAQEAAQLALMHSEAEVVIAREELNELLALNTTQTNWTAAAESLPAIPVEDLALARLETFAVAQRFDLAAVRAAVKQSSLALASARRWRYLGSNQVSLDAENDQDRGHRVLGPNISMELPIFDRRQAAIARAEATLRASQAEARATENRVRSDVRSAYRRLVAQRDLAQRYREALIPARERVVALAQAHQNYMVIGQFELLVAKRDEIEAYRDYVDAVREYWVARADLTRAVGGKLPEDAVSPAPNPAPPATERQHYQ